MRRYHFRIPADGNLSGRPIDRNRSAVLRYIHNCHPLQLAFSGWPPSICSRHQANHKHVDDGKLLNSYNLSLGSVRIAAAPSAAAFGCC
jgi:hypothetical protein